MKTTWHTVRTATAVVAMGALLPFAAALASEVSGSLSTGMSSGVEGILVVAPTVSPSAGTYTSAQSVTLRATGSSSIRYTQNDATPTCSSGSTYSGAISVGTTQTIKAISCYPDSVASSVVSYTFTINIPSSSGGGGGGGGGGGSYIPLPTPSSGTTTVAVPTTTSVTVISPFVPAETVGTGSGNGTSGSGGGSGSDMPCVTASDIYLAQVQSDANTFGVTLTASDKLRFACFIQNGTTRATILLGTGERRAVVRDCFETMRKANIPLSDFDRIAMGLIPVTRNLPLERAAAPRALATFKTIYGNRAPNFESSEENLFWNTLMYRIRFPRDLVAEKQGILKFKKLFSKNPSDPFQWAVVRGLGYVKK